LFSAAIFRAATDENIENVYLPESFLRFGLGFEKIISIFGLDFEKIRLNFGLDYGKRKNYF
jgi:hypothetical protein